VSANASQSRATALAQYVSTVPRSTPAGVPAVGAPLAEVVGTAFAEVGTSFVGVMRRVCTRPLTIGPAIGPGRLGIRSGAACAVALCHPVVVPAAVGLDLRVHWLSTGAGAAPGGSFPQAGGLGDAMSDGRGNMGP
jgi:hypothetical protein